MKIIDIARVAHDVNAEYCKSICDYSQVPFEDAEEWQRQSAINGVKLHLHGDHGPEESHESWLVEKLEAGWVYGEVKDVDKREHPCMVDFKDLPTEQQSKDFIFRAIVLSMKHLLGE